MAVKEKEKIYEVSVHYVPALEDAEIAKKIADLKETISASGTVLGEDPMQKISLAYTIRHKVRQSDGVYDRYDESHFGSVKFRSPQSLVRDIHTLLQGDGQVIRFIVLETADGDTRIGPVLPGEEKEEEGAEKEEKEGEKKADDKKKAKKSDGDE
ncbi:MAG: 30S ribosomal protein S6 [Candidatus Kaiserbacteria bacterium]|nr:30S ribosomal protein S6 [Candidatus Kaiserbacteria bacterium]